MVTLVKITSVLSQRQNAADHAALVPLVTMDGGPTRWRVGVAIVLVVVWTAGELFACPVAGMR